MTHDTRASNPTQARHLLADLRPQAYSSGPPSRVLDPIVEPLWTGLRVLAAIDVEGVILVDADGDPVAGMGVIVEALAAAVPMSDVVVDGFITKQATRSASAVAAWPDEMPSMTGLIGLRRNRATDALDLKEASLEAAAFDEDDEVSFVATDLLWLDETSLLDVPLLERRRLLEAVLREADSVRLGAFVRPPIDAWVGSWRSQGFEGVTFKAANSRYLPGRPNPDWVITGMPRR